MTSQRFYHFQFNELTTFVNSKFAKKHVFCLRMFAEVVVSIILFAISMFGNMSVLRLLRIFRERALISHDHLTKIGTAACALVNLVVFQFAKNIFLLGTGVCGSLTVIYLTLALLERRQIDTLKRELPHFLDRWIMNMKLGNAVSSARDTALLSSPARVRALLLPLFTTTQTPAQSHLLLDARMIKELTEAAQIPHSALHRLENLREMWRKADIFRRKSGQAVMQTAIQGWVLLFLTLALAVFTVRRYGWSRTSDLILCSFLLSGSGFLVMRRLARKTKWKI